MTAELNRRTLEGLPKNGPTDPIDYYKRPLVGWLFRERINMGLRMLDHPRYERALEVGYSAGAVLIALAPLVGQLHGLDLDAAPAPVNDVLQKRGFSANLVQGNVYQLPYDDGQFDLVVCFSVFEHLHEYQRALGEVSRVLRPGGQFLLGMPAVNQMMEAAFRIIGFRRIGDHHVTRPRDVSDHFLTAGFEVRDRRTLDVPLTAIHLYYAWLLQKS